MSIEAIKSFGMEKIKQFPDLEEDIRDLMEMGIDEIEDEGSEQGEYDLFVQSVEERIDESKGKR
jgi:hypothetical protein